MKKTCENYTYLARKLNEQIELSDDDQQHIDSCEDCRSALLIREKLIASKQKTELDAFTIWFKHHQQAEIKNQHRALRPFLIFNLTVLMLSMTYVYFNVDTFHVNTLTSNGSMFIIGFLFLISILLNSLRTNAIMEGEY